MVNYILHELLADWPDVFTQCGAEHHYLFAVWCVSVDFLDVTPHVCNQKISLS